MGTLGWPGGARSASFPSVWGPGGTPGREDQVLNLPRARLGVSLEPTRAQRAEHHPHPPTHVHTPSLLGVQVSPTRGGVVSLTRARALLRTGEVGRVRRLGGGSCLFHGLSCWVCGAEGVPASRGCPEGEGCWLPRKSGEGREGWGMGVVTMDNNRVCMTLSQSQRLSLDLRGDREPGQQEG